ncbi:MAG: hypothetical protein J6X19_05140 [Clostridia bacterium]|nr:hypothetical protein [Clostridia bacterium]
MNSDDLHNAFENIDDTFAAQSEAARSGFGLGAGDNAAKQNGNRRGGQRSRVFPVLSLVLLLAVGLAVGLLISAKGKKSRSNNTMLNNNTPIPTATLPPATETPGPTATLPPATASTTEQPSAAAASPTPVDHPPQDELLKIEVFNGEVRFMRIATTPEAAYYQKGTAHIPFNTIPNVSEGAPVSDPYAVLHALFLAVDKKEASASGWYNGNVFDHYVYLYDKDTAIPWHYVFAFDESGEMMVVNNGELIAFVKLSEAEAASILATLPVRETGDRPATEVPATATPAPTPTPRDEKRDRLNELITESYKSLTESERAAFEAAHPAESHEDFALRYFDGEGGYAFKAWTSYGVFSGASVWFMPGVLQWEYENTVCGYTFFFSSDCRILAVKDGEECEIDDAYRKGWLTEEDIAKLHEIHTLVLSIYYNLNS